MTKEELRKQYLSYHKNFIKNTFVGDFLDLADGFSETVQFLVSIILFAIHLLVLPILIPISLTKYFRWKCDGKYQNRMWEIYQNELKNELKAKEKKLFSLTQKAEENDV